MKSRALLLAPMRSSRAQFFSSSTSTSIRPLLLRPEHSQNSFCRTFTSHKPLSSSQPTATQTIRPLIPPPSEQSGPLMSRRSDRALPTLNNTPLRTWLKTLPIFIFCIVASSLAIFNYQKSSSSTVNSILYALRTNPQARELLGDEIYFASKVPWIRGELNQLHGRIDVRFWVKGTRDQGETRFKSERKKRDGFFETTEWSLELSDGRKVQLLNAGDDGVDPLRKM